MASTWLYLAILAVTGTFWEETSARSLRDAIKPRRFGVLREAKIAFRGATGVKFNLASSYGHLDSNSLKMLDSALKVMIGGILELDFHKDLTWDDLRFAFDTNPYMKRYRPSSAYKLERISFSSTPVFGIRKNKSKRKKFTLSWFRNLIGNLDILEDTDIDLTLLADTMSAFKVNLRGNIMTHKTRKMVLMDQGIIRFPDISRPFITLYRINLMGKCSYKTYILHQKETSDIVGLFQKEVYYADRDYIRSLGGDVIGEIIAEVEELFA